MKKIQKIRQLIIYKESILPSLISIKDIDIIKTNGHRAIVKYKKRYYIYNSLVNDLQYPSDDYDSIYNFYSDLIEEDAMNE